MTNDTREALRAALLPLFPEVGLDLRLLPDERSWSKVYEVRAEPDTRVFVKGVLRVMPEARTTVHLAARCPDSVPAVIHPDLLPESDWQWFAMAYAGECTHLVLTPEQAGRVARALGALQREMQTDTVLASMLPSCLPEQLYSITESTCAWLLQHGDDAMRGRLRPLYPAVRRLAPAFLRVSLELATMPPTCVHGDFCAGNITARGADVRIIDWGEAIWGVGGASIWNLLLSSQPTLKTAASDVWDAYGQGLGCVISQAYIDAARIAFFVTMLAVDRAYGDANDAETMRGMAETLENVVRCMREHR